MRSVGFYVGLLSFFGTVAIIRVLQSFVGLKSGVNFCLAGCWGMLNEKLVEQYSFRLPCKITRNDTE